MGFFFRKSIGFGPIRFNFSKSGVGVSTGIKGARIWTGPRGTYVQVGREGLYYRQKIGNLGEAGKASPTTNSTGDWNNNLVELPHGELFDSIKLPPRDESPLIIHVLYLITTVATIISLGYFASNNLEVPARVATVSWLLFTIPPLFWLIGVSLHYRAKIKVLPPLHPLYYRLDSERLSRSSNIENAFRALTKSQQLFSIKQGQVPAFLAIKSPPLIVTNVTVWSLTISNWTMFFMPERAYIFTNGAYSTVPYEDLTVSYKEWRTTVYSGLPGDATVVDRTWLHTRKDGYPDRRYNYNPSIPIALYGYVDIESKAGWTISLRVSNLEAAKDCFRYLSKVLRTPSRDTYSGWQSSYQRQTSSNSRQDSSSRKQSSPSSTSTQKSPYEILGVKEGASIEEVTAAYRKQAQMNHPDRVANMAGEFRELAERRMKEINAAYNELRKKWR